MHYDELINARFVESCESQDLQRQQEQSGFNGSKERIAPFFMTTEDKLFIKKQIHDTQECNAILSKSQEKPRAKRTTFLN